MLHVRFERSDGIFEEIPEDERENVSAFVVVGPYEWVQLTYSDLRVAPDGDFIAYCEGGYWRVRAGEAETHNAGIDSYFSAPDAKHPFSDVVVY